jgi:hypothetical protein
MHLTPEKVEGWLKILGNPLLWRMLENARNTREEIAARILSSDGPASLQRLPTGVHEEEACRITLGIGLK